MNLSDDNEEDTLELASKTWNRVINSATKTGYREGIQDGAMSAFQEGFDKGYKDAFVFTSLIGIYKGLKNTLLKDLDHPEEIENILQTTKKGVCYLCEIEANAPIDLLDKSLSEVSSCQDVHTTKVLNILKNYFDPLLEEFNINSNYFSFNKD